MEEPSTFLQPRDIAFSHTTKSLNSDITSTELKNMEYEAASLENVKQNETTEEIPNWEDTCRVCANCRDHMIPIFENEGAEHNLSNKIHMYLPIEVSKTDSLPLKLCYHCAATLLAWHDLVTSCLDAEKRLLQTQAEMQQKETIQLKNQQISNSNALMDGIITQNEESGDTFQSIATQKLPNPGLPPLSHELQNTEIIQLKYIEKSNLTELSDGNVVENELVDDPEPVETQISEITSLPQKETESSLICEREESCTIQQLEQTSEIVEQSSLDQETAERSGVTRQRRFASFRRKRRDSTPGNGTTELTKVSAHPRRHNNGDSGKKREAKFLKENTKNLESGGEFSCEKCWRVFMREANLKRHAANCRGKYKIRKSTLSPQENHPEEAHTAMTAPDKKSTETYRIVEAETTEEVNSSDERTIAKKRKSPCYPCLYCEYTTLKKKSLNQHTLAHHSEALNTKREKNQRSINKDLVKHARMEANGRVYYHCNDCGKNLFSPYTFTWHVRIHTGERPFTCHLCGKQFRVNQGLARHLRETHAGIKKFPCDLCGRMFSTKRNVEDHRRIHTGERPYVCNVCGKAFKQKASLFVHNRTHTDVFPFKCSYCGQGFRTRPPLVIHLTKHTGEKPHTCDICERAFRIKYELKRHRLIHFDEKPWQCSDCGLSFRQKRYLVNHKKINHNCGSTTEETGTNCESRVTKDDLVSGGAMNLNAEAL